MAARFSVEAVFKAVDRITAPVTRMQNRVGKFSRTMQRGLRKVNRTLDKTIRGLKTGATRAIGFATVAITGLTAATLGFIKAASRIEDATAAFTPLLGSAKRAEELVARLNKTAASTPFQFDNLAKAAGQLLPVMEGDIDRTIKTLRQLGDTAGGNAQKLDSITRGFTKAMLKGKVDMESLNMIAEAGVPIFTELADSMGVKVNSAFFKMISAGKVATKDLTKAFDKMTSAGGVFFEGMVIASRTQSGLWSTFKDNVQLTAAAIGQQLLPTSKKYTIEAIKIAARVREWVTANKDLIGQRLGQTITFLKDNLAEFGRVALGVLKIVGAIVTASVALKTVMLAITISTKAWTVAAIAFNLAMGLTRGLLLTNLAATNTSKAASIAWAVGTKIATAAMWLFNAAMSANPIALVSIAVAGLITAGVLLVKNWDNIKAKIVSVVDAIKPKLESIAAPFKAILAGTKAIAGSARKVFGFGGDEEEAGSAEGQRAIPQIVPPQERVAQSIEERRETSTAELTIKDETGRGELTQKGEATGSSIKLAASGAF